VRGTIFIQVTSFSIQMISQKILYQTKLRPLLIASSIVLFSFTQSVNANKTSIKMPSAPVQASTQAVCKSLDDWNAPTHARRIYGNTWYVGTCGISVVLIATPNGHVLIDSAPEKASAAVRQNILSLGIKLSDIKTILLTHEHHDHMGGLASMQTATGAKVLSRSNVVDVLKSGKMTDVIHNLMNWQASIRLRMFTRSRIAALSKSVIHRFNIFLCQAMHQAVLVGLGKSAKKVSAKISCSQTV